MKECCKEMMGIKQRAIRENTRVAVAPNRFAGIDVSIIPEAITHCFCGEKLKEKTKRILTISLFREKDGLVSYKIKEEYSIYLHILYDDTTYDKNFIDEQQIEFEYYEE